MNSQSNKEPKQCFLKVNDIQIFISEFDNFRVMVIIIHYIKAN